MGTLEGPELSSASHLSAESFDSQSIGTASVASHLSEAATGAGVAQVRMNAKVKLLVRLSKHSHCVPLISAVPA